MPTPCVNPTEVDIIPGGPYTRKQMRSIVTMQLQEFSGSDGARSPQLMNFHIAKAANQMATQCWAFFERRWLDIVLNPATGEPAYEYNLFDVFEPEAAQIRWPNPQGDPPVSTTTSIQLLQFSTPQIMDSMWGPTWRDPNTAQVGNPIWIIWEGLNRFQLYPRPNYVTECQSGIGIEGYFNCGAWDKSIPPADPLQDDAYCPLPAHVHDGVVALATINRLRELNNPQARLRMKDYMDEYKPFKQMLATMALNRFGNTKPQDTGYSFYGQGLWLGTGL